MYTDYWGLERKPFENTPQPEFFYHAPEHSMAFERLAHLIQQRQGAALLTGDYGCGKTTMIQVLVEELDLGQHPIAYLDYPRLTAEEFTGAILRALGADDTGDAIERSQRLGELLLRASEEGGHTVVIVDEAQIIPEDGVLVELDRILDHRLKGESLVTFLLVGEPSLADRVLRFPRLDCRIGLRHHLLPLDREQTRGYIAYRLDVAGADRPLFTEGAMDLIFEQSAGTPRQINSVCDMSLFVGARRKASIIDETIVRMVA